MSTGNKLGDSRTSRCLEKPHGIRWFNVFVFDKLDEILDCSNTWILIADPMAKEMSQVRHLFACDVTGVAYGNKFAYDVPIHSVYTGVYGKYGSLPSV